jgi:hypothetical protein
LIAPTSDERPVRWMRKIHASVPPCSSNAALESGGYIVQPASGGE